MKTHLLPSVLALLCATSAMAAEYYVVVPVKGRTAAAPAESIAVSLQAAMLPPATVGQAYSYNLRDHLLVTGDKALDLNQATLTTADTLPDGLSLAANGVLSGTPTIKNESGSSFQVVASYKTKTGQQAYTISVSGITFAASEWNPSLVSSTSTVVSPSQPGTVTFSESNRVVSFSAGLRTVGGPALPTSGKWYWEVERINGAYLMSGMSTAPLGTHLYAYGCGAAIGTAGVGMFAGSSATSSSTGAAGSGARFGFSFDAGTRTLSIYQGAVLIGNCSIAGTAPLYVTGLNPDSWSGGALRAHFLPEHQTLQVPAKFIRGIPLN